MHIHVSSHTPTILKVIAYIVLSNQTIENSEYLENLNLNKGGRDHW